jgi:hypothetical protein
MVCKREWTKQAASWCPNGCANGWASLKEEYQAALGSVQRGGWAGAKIFDALLLTAAAKCKTERIYTFNLSHFTRLAPPELLSKICAP